MSEFEEVVERCQRRLFSYAYYVLGRPEEAEEVVQECFVRLWKHWESVELDRVTAWLLRVTRNLCWDRLRVRRRTADRVTPLDDVSMQRLSDDAPGPERKAESSEFRRELRRALDELREPMRSVIVLREVQGLKYREIAEALEMPLNTVRVHVHRGRKRLRESLGEAAYERTA